ncbi:hypothetical protein HYW60_02855 [Candidatus Kaiserbacteria bacterium]|nr:hypothetical protein [Candidatus Kaiserbacteria bacterium]
MSIATAKRGLCAHEICRAHPALAQTAGHEGPAMEESMKKMMLALVATFALPALASMPASAATEAELKAQCEADGGRFIPHPGGQPECNHPDPASAAQATPAPAAEELAPNTFKDGAGNVWTIVSGGNGAPPSALNMAPDADKACPSRKVKLEPVKGKTNAPAFTADQKFRGDKRWHIACVR